MVSRQRRWLLLFLGGFALTGAPVEAAEEPRQPRFVGMINVDALLNSYVQLVARKYDLTREQEAETRTLVRDKLHTFLDRHEDRVFDLVTTLFEVRSGGEFSQAELQAWGRDVAPLYEDARALILTGNEEYRALLNDKQRQVHDRDLQIMERNFALSKQQIERMVNGTMTVEEFRNPPRFDHGEPPQRRARLDSRSQGELRPIDELPPPVTHDSHRHVSTAPPRVDRVQPPEAPAPRTDDAQEPRTQTDAWERYVEAFIARYKLNEAQAQKARTLLRQCRTQAERHLQRQSAKLKLIGAQLRDSRQKNAAREVKQLEQRRAAVLAPVEQIFTQRLKPALEKLPTRAQRETAAPAAANETDTAE